MSDDEPIWVRETRHRRVKFDYVNYRGERSFREVTPIGLSFGPTPHHPGPGFRLRAFDHDKQAVRDFNMSDIQHWEELEPPE